MSTVTSPSLGNPRARRHEGFEDECIPEGRPQAKRLRSGEDYPVPRSIPLPKWLSQESPNRSSHDSYRRNLNGNTPDANQSRTNTNHLQERGLKNIHARIYVGNLPKHARLSNAAYKELFAALYVTAFEPLKPGQASPVQLFWLHACGKYGFLQMRGSREAVNIMLFNGLSLHRRTIRLSRPTGYRLEVRDLSAEEYVPDRVDSDRMAVLLKELCGIIEAPREKTYLMALERPKEDKTKTLDVIEKLSTSGSNSAGFDTEAERVDVDSVEGQTRFSSDGGGTVVELVDMAKSFNLDDQSESKTSCMMYGRSAAGLEKLGVS